VQTTHASALQVVMRVSSQDSGFLVFSDTYYPGWKAYIDGKNSPIYEVNLVQRAVKIDKGSHTVVEKVNLVHHEKQGENQIYYFSVSDNANFFRLAFSTRDLSWKMKELYNEG
jgi:uncharacterized membrane protein YfhO